MKSLFRQPVRVPAASALLAALLAAGCASERVTAEYTMPARAVADVGAVSLLDVVSTAELSGNRVADGDDARAAAIVRQHLSARLYQEGYYRTTDAVWGPDAGGAATVADLVRKNGSRHGYPSFGSTAPDATGRLELSLELSVDATRETRREPIELEIVPYTVERGGVNEPPVSYPNLEATMTRTETAVYDVWKVSGSGTLSAKLVDAKTGETVYERTFPVEPPDDDARCEPTLLRAVSAAVDPAIREIVVDISPHRESRSFEVDEDAHPRVVAFLSAKDYVDTVLEVERLEAEKAAAGRKGGVYEPVAADFGNQAVALEVLGEYAQAKSAWEKALALDSGYAAAEEGVRRTGEILAGRDAIRASGAKKTGGTGYGKGAVDETSF